MRKNKYPRRGITESEMVYELKKAHGDRYDYNFIGYKDKQTKIPIVCHEVDEYGNEHGVFWSLPYFHLKGHGCPICGRSNAANKNKLPISEVIDKIKSFGYDVGENFEYKSNHSEIRVICKKHGEFTTRLSNLINRNGICRKCRFETNIISVMEASIKEKLELNGTCYESQYNVPSSLLRLDFYLPQYNCAIECQGIQHFKAVEHFGGDEGFSKTRERDTRKKRLCEDNGIRIFYYSNDSNDEFLGEKVYHDFDEMIRDMKNSDNKS